MKGMGATPATNPTRGTGRSRGTVGITSTGIELGLDVGIGQLGISTDYGGGIVIAIFGQKIVWGREGGKIHYNLGGFEVLVEARDCVVVETRKIAGQVVGRHVYPDPGCKLPKEEEPQTPKIPNSVDPNIPLPVEVPDIDLNGWVFVHVYSEALTFSGEFQSSIFFRKILSPIEEKLPAFVGRAPLTQYSEVRSFAPTARITTQETTPQNTTLRVHQIPVQDFFTGATLAIHNASSRYFTGDRNPLFFWGTFRSIRQFLIAAEEEFNRRKKLDKYLYPGTYVARSYIPFLCLPYYGKLENTVKLSPAAGNQPLMPESCCESLKADIEDIKEVLATKEILAGKMTFPWKWRMPGGEGTEIIMDYPSLLRAIAQMIDHLGIHPPKLSIKDINNAIAGDQSLNNQFPSATQAFEALMIQVWDANGDVDTLTNLIYRLAWLGVQNGFNLAQITGSIEALKDMIGGETEPLETTLTTPFNIAAGTGAKKTPPGKGFGKQANKAGEIDNRVDVNTEMATEAMLSEFMKVRHNPIMIDSFSGKQDIFDQLALIRADLEKLKNK